MTRTRNHTDEISRAEAQVQKRKTQLSRSLRDVEDSGKQMVERVRDELKPAVHTALLVAGATAILGVALIVATRSRRSYSGWLAPSRPSALGVLAKTAGLWALRAVARRAAQEVVSRLNESHAPPAAAPQP